MARQRIAVIAGDGIGVEVIGAGRRTLDALQQLGSALDFEYVEFPWGSAYYLEHGSMMPPDGIEQLASFDAIYFGAVGWPT
ncbi:MAG TPA: isocitrate/isopropylmalate family dehydrogenase, partial [Ktedonobacterales bacterium]